MPQVVDQFGALALRLAVSLGRHSRRRLGAGQERPTELRAVLLDLIDDLCVRLRSGYPCPDLPRIREAVLQLLHLMPQLLEHAHRLLHLAPDVRLQPRVAQRGAPGDLELGRKLLKRLHVGDAGVGQGIGVARVMAHNRIHEQSRVADRAGYRAVDRSVVPAEHLERAFRHAAESGLQAEAAGVASGDADGAAAVRAGGQRHHAGGDRRRGAAAGAAGRALQVPGVARDPEQQVLGERRVPELRRVGLAQQDGARLLQPLHLHGVPVRPVVLVRHRGVCGWESLGVLQLLHAEGEPGQRADILPAGDAVRSGTGVRQRLLRSHGDEGVEGRIDLLDALEGGLHQLHGRELARANRRREFVSRFEPELRHGHSSPSGVCAGTRDGMIHQRCR